MGVDLLANDTDPDGDTLEAALLTAPGNGSATLAGGRLTYTPDGDWNGTDTLTYLVRDPDGSTSTATVTIVVTPVADPPRAVDDGYAGMAGQPLTGSLLDNDGDEDGDPLTVVADTSPDLDVNADGTFTWTPPSPGVRAFTYTVSDGTSTATATVTVTVTAAPPTQQVLYLQGSPAGVRGELSSTAPGPSADWDRDANPGVTIRKGKLDKDDDEDDEDEGGRPPRFREWAYTVPAGGLRLDGPVRLLLTSRTDRLDPRGDHVDYSVRLDSCARTGVGCVRLASVEDVHVDDWSPGSGYETRTIQVGSVNRTVPAGQVLRLRVQVENNDLWVPLDGTDPSSLVLPTSD